MFIVVIPYRPVSGGGGWCYAETFLSTATNYNDLMPEISRIKQAIRDHGDGDVYDVGTEYIYGKDWGDIPTVELSEAGWTPRPDEEEEDQEEYYQVDENEEPSPPTPDPDIAF